MATYSDDFNRANEVLSAGANWSSINSWEMQLTGNRVSTSPPDAMDIFDGGTPGNDQWAECTINTPGTDSAGGTIIRNGTGENHYECAVGTFTPYQYTIDRAISGTYVNLATVSPGPGPGGPTQLLRLQAIGTTIKMFVDNVEIASVTDSNHTAGKCGMWGYGPTSMVFDDFRCGDTPYPSAPTTDQEGFRFRNDNGSETTATWLAAEDTNATAPLSANLRLRTLIDGAGDTPSTAYTLYSKKSTDSIYRPVPLAGASLTWAFNTLGAAPAVTGTSTVSVAYPASLAAGDLIICPIASRLGSTSVDTESGWSTLANYTANVATSEGTAGTEAADTGGVRISVFYKISDGTETGTVAFSNTGTATLSTFGQMISYRKPWWATWSLADANGKDASSGSTSYSAAMGADPGIAVGDILLACTAANTDTPTWSAETVTGTGLTTSLTSERVDIAVTGGNDTRLIMTEHSVSAASTSGVPTYAATMSTTAPEAATVLTRIRATGAPPIVVSPSSNITAGGVATTAQLTAPSGKSTSDFVTGRMWDDENGTDSIDITTDDYTELEWSLLAQSPAANADIYTFRVYAGASPLTSYTVTPQWTIGSGAQTVGIGIASETDTALALTRSKRKTVGIASETDSALSITRGHRVTVGIASETDTAIAEARAKRKAIGIAAETDSAPAVTTPDVNYMEWPFTQADGDAIGWVSWFGEPILDVVGNRAETTNNAAYQSYYDITPVDWSGGDFQVDADIYAPIIVSQGSVGFTMLDATGTGLQAVYSNSSHLYQWTSGVRGAAQTNDPRSPQQGHATMQYDSSTGELLSFFNGVEVSHYTFDAGHNDYIVLLVYMLATEFPAETAWIDNLRVQNYLSTPSLTRVIDTAVETDTALALGGRSKRKTIGIASETDTALAVTSGYRVTVGIASETDTAVALGAHAKRKAIGIASETDTALALTRAKRKTIGIASETDSALAVSRAKRKTIGIASESDTAQAVGRAKRKAIGIASETDAALAVSARHTRTVGIAAETDTADALAKSKRRTLGLAGEIDSAINIVAEGATAVQPAAETDTAGAVTFSKRKTVTLATETDTAGAVARAKRKTVGIAGETDSAVALGARRKLRTLGIAVEIDEARGVVIVGATLLGPAPETDSAGALSHSKRAAIGIASESDGALALAHSRRRLVGIAAELDVALAVIYAAGHQIGAALETDAALPVLTPKRLTVGTAVEVDMALAIHRLLIIAAGFAYATWYGPQAGATWSVPDASAEP